jgi:hypothetical protein
VMSGRIYKHMESGIVDVHYCWELLLDQHSTLITSADSTWPKGQGCLSMCELASGVKRFYCK